MFGCVLQCSNYRGGTGGIPPLRLWTPCNTRRRSVGAFGASVSSPRPSLLFLSSTTGVLTPEWWGIIKLVIRERVQSSRSGRTYPSGSWTWQEQGQCRPMRWTCTDWTTVSWITWVSIGIGIPDGIIKFHEDVVVTLHLIGCLCKVLAVTTILATRRSQHSQECKNPRQHDLDLWLFEHKINGFPGLIVKHFYVKFDDPSWSGF